MVSSAEGLDTLTTVNSDRLGRDHRPRIAWSMARGIVSVVFCGYGLIDMLTVSESHVNAGQYVLAIGCLIALLWLQLGHFSRPGARLRSRRGYVFLGVQACLVYLPMLEFGQAWVGLPGFLAGCVLLVLPTPVAWAAFAVVVASMGWIQSLLDSSVLDLIYTTLGVGLYGLEVYLLTRLAVMAAELHTARTELAQRAVSEERLRFARDLHDMLGLSLSAITLKGELAHRLVPTAPERAGAELVEVVDLARRALADVRSVARGYRELSFEQECRSAESLLRSSGVQVEVRLDYVHLPNPIRTAFGAALREAVANVLRHSKAEHCEIVVTTHNREACLDIVNDGCDAVTDDYDSRVAARGEFDRSGIQNLADRVASVDGLLTSGVEPDGRFRLCLRAPLFAASGRADPTRPNGATGSRESRPRTLPVDALSLRVLLTIVMCGLCVSAAIHLLYMTTAPGAIACGTAYLVALLVLQLAYVRRPTAAPRSVLGYALLAVQAALIYLPLLQFHQNWVSLPGFLGGTSLLVLPSIAGLAVFAATVVSVVVSHVVFTGQALDVLFNGVATVISGLVVFGLTWLAILVGELNSVRTRLARTAVADERLRFARDLHDLLGLSLSAITLRTELAIRLLPAYPERTREELVDILELARQALAEVRSVAGGYRELSLETETRSAESVLAAAEVDLRMEIDHGRMPPHVHTALAVVLREGVTNVLRHSDARHCEITLRQDTEAVRLDIVNDGVRHAQDHSRGNDGGGGDTRGSSGIRNLSERLTRLGGELGTEIDAAGRFRLWAALPNERLTAGRPR
jgi:signal transduction histidine kinase